MLSAHFNAAFFGIECFSCSALYVCVCVYLSVHAGNFFYLCEAIQAMKITIKTALKSRKKEELNNDYQFGSKSITSRIQYNIE